MVQNLVPLIQALLQRLDALVAPVMNLIRQAIDPLIAKRSDRDARRRFGHKRTSIRANNQKLHRLFFPRITH